MLGAVIVTAIMSLFDFGEMWHAMFVAPLDFLVMIFTFGVTFFWNIEKGLIYGLIASVFVLIYQMTKLDVESVRQKKKKNFFLCLCKFSIARVPIMYIYFKIQGVTFLSKYSILILVMSLGEFRSI